MDLPTNIPQPSPESSQQQPRGPYGAVIYFPHSLIPPEVCSPHSSLVFLAPSPSPIPRVSFRGLIIHPTLLAHPQLSNIRHLTTVLTATDPDNWTEQELRQWLKNVCCSLLSSIEPLLTSLQRNLHPSITATPAELLERVKANLRVPRV
jgi:hypothetical protein